MSKMRQKILNILVTLLFRMEALHMVTIYVTLIVNGYKKFEQVPVKLQPQVEAELKALGLDRDGNPLPVEA